MTNHILIVDSDTAFATILKEGIEMGGDYRATVAATASEARDVAARGHLALAIVDMGLQDGDSLELLHTLREGYPDLRLMAIPLDDLPDEVMSLGLQGILPKPFFLPDVPSQIEDVLSRPVEALPNGSGQGGVKLESSVELTRLEATLPTAATAPTPTREPASAVPAAELLAHLASESQRLTDHLRYLSNELNAEAVLLTYGAELVAYAGQLGRADAERLAYVVSESWQASARVAAALGREKVRFEQSLHEGEDYLLYSRATTSDIVLSVALRADRPLGMIRYNTKQTVQELEPLLLPPRAMD